MNLFKSKKFLPMLRKNYLKICIIVFILVAMCFALYLIGFRGGRLKLFSKAEIENMVTSYGRLSSMFFISIYLIKTFFVILPTSLLVVLGGRLFGSLYGFIYSMIGALMSATLAFYVGRYAGRDFIEKLAGKRVGYVNDKVESYGIRVIASMRLAFVIPFDVLSYGAGLTKMKYRDFIVGTFLGIVAEVFCLNYLGEKMQRVGSKGFIVSIVMLIIVIFIPIAISKFKKMKYFNSQTQPAEDNISIDNLISPNKKELENLLNDNNFSIININKELTKSVNDSCKDKYNAKK